MGENPERAAGIYISGIEKMCAARHTIRKNVYLLKTSYNCTNQSECEKETSCDN